ncbi:hypothetical protein ILUMI_11237 [Ignelater luminosus]|uniref:Uncharacterized protein n=1 Tax=Ignelater luminosus TaxID=2038154 RepID=A0A8K0D0L9_IGNLU|nr:hypothetical protein ILUMI_11237 [Ignelater luminosus]
MNNPTAVTVLVSVCAAVAVAIQSNVQVFTKQQLIDKLPLHDGNFQAHAAISSQYREDCNSSIIPPDDGAGSYGDLIYSEPRSLDDLLLREIFVNYNVSNEEQIVFWNKMFWSKCVNHVKVLNFGRDRAFTKYVYVNNTMHQGGNVDINLLIPVGKEVRMFFEVFGRDMYALTSCD